uniref:Uncharacterized protein n=1 Tax=Prolemur simus TaxID=1328070 RepID=A0A8C8ZQU4_PROSS
MGSAVPAPIFLSPAGFAREWQKFGLVKLEGAGEPADRCPGNACRVPERHRCRSRAGGVRAEGFSGAVLAGQTREEGPLRYPWTNHDRRFHVTRTDQ